ncbi:hypothetical protein [Paenibacillus donghaensis]|uniref:Uncharacterized protein n=1 Tax=Paenibacillus donghaensis TaxID=414771 RepID=A0A2Z2KTG6_9BACL|nr:hypothetical protein [Paenibacillus donghaensis]ASA22718.1 hypothetical protein B9T62_19115 [Paenibacillus donghaensis]
MENLNLFEVLQILAKNYKMKAVKSNGCEIAWKDQVIDNSAYKAPNTEYKQLVFVSLTGHESTNILTDNMIEQQNINVWKIVEDK